MSRDGVISGVPTSAGFPRLLEKLSSGDTASHRGDLDPARVRRYSEPGTNWTFDKSDGPGGGLASKAHLAVWGRGRETPSTWVVHRIARAYGVYGHDSVTPRPRGPGWFRNPGLLGARLQLRRLREAGLQRLSV